MFFGPILLIILIYVVYKVIGLESHNRGNFNSHNENSFPNIQRLNQTNYKVNCPNCNYLVEPNFNFCPNCNSSLTQKICGCGQTLQSKWSFCPNCGKKE